MILDFLVEVTHFQEPLIISAVNIFLGLNDIQAVIKLWSWLWQQKRCFSCMDKGVCTHFVWEMLPGASHFTNSAAALFYSREIAVSGLSSWAGRSLTAIKMFTVYMYNQHGSRGPVSTLMTWYWLIKTTLQLEVDRVFQVRLACTTFLWTTFRHWAVDRYLLHPLYCTICTSYSKTVLRKGEKKKQLLPSHDCSKIMDVWCDASLFMFCLFLKRNRKYEDTVSSGLYSHCFVFLFPRDNGLDLAPHSL